MSSGPEKVSVKRKRDELAPGILIVESEVVLDRQGKKLYTDEDATATKQLQYVRIEKSTKEKELKKVVEDAEFGEMEKGKEMLGTKSRETRKASKAGERRVFHLKMDSSRMTKLGRKGAKVDEKARRNDIATFVEARGGARHAGSRNVIARSSTSNAAAVPAQPFKRPGRGAAVGSSAAGSALSQGSQSSQDHERMEKVANNLHQFALDQVEALPKPQVTSLPKFPGRRRNLEHPPAGMKEPRIHDDEAEDVEMDSDDDYVYDTYVLAPNGASTAPDQIMSDEASDVGYLVITGEDQAVWETYIEDESSDEDANSDDEDENAEGHYGADYPEDEMASDDEGGRNAYGYRANGASDEEEWDEDTGAHSDEDEYERTMNPWKTKTPNKMLVHLDSLDGGEGRS